jgi:response regulator RpfG family c-di-GMP phosphodiesterase
MKKLLVVEDDQFFREAMVKYLREHNYEVMEAANGKVARDICGLQKFDLILSDIQMPFLDGIELLKWVKSTHPTPFVLMTGFSNLLETQTAYQLGADEFLTKPFQNTELHMVIRGLLSPEKKNVVGGDNLDEVFCKVSIDEFVSKSIIEFDVFVRLSEKKYVKIGVAGDRIPVERIASYQEKGISYLHIRREDFPKLVSFNLELSKVVAKSSDVSLEKKINFMKYTGEVILEKAFVQGVDKESFSQAQDMLVTTVNMLTDSPEHLGLLEVLNAHSDWIYAHSIASSMFSMMIARRMGFTASQVFFKLGMAGLYHEIGYKEIPCEILEKSRPLLSQAERSMIETHVSRSREILSLVRGTPPDVIEIVYQQHEDILGQGYPRRLDKNRIHPLAKIFQVADQFAEFAIKGPHHLGMDGPAAVAHIENFCADKYDKQVVRALRSIFVQSTSRSA